MTYLSILLESPIQDVRSTLQRIVEDLILLDDATVWYIIVHHRRRRLRSEYESVKSTTTQKNIPPVSEEDL